MSNHEPTSDQKFVLTFIVIIAVMALFSVAIFVLAQVLAAEEETRGSAERSSVSTNMSGDARVWTKEGVAAPVATAKVKEISVEKVIKRCGGCHLAGSSGAPKFADNDAWAQRFKERGKAGLINSVIGGRGRMGKRGGQAITDEKIAEAVTKILADAGVK